MSIIDTVLGIAWKEVGVHESGGNNRGKRVEEYLASVGLPAGEPWCAAFVSWCLQQAGVKGAPCTGDTWGLEGWGAQHGCLYNEDPRKPEQPQRGDIFLLLGSDNRPTHTGLVTGVGSGYVDTIEGNTGMASDTDGDGVAAKRRSISACSFVRWAQVCEASPPQRRLVKIFRKPERAVIVVDGQEHELRSMSIDGAAPAAGTSTTIVCEY